MQYSFVLVSSVLQCSGGDSGGRGGVGGGETSLGTLLFGVTVASLIFIDAFGYWRKCFIAIQRHCSVRLVVVCD